jgi:hypothetical protein
MKKALVTLVIGDRYLMNFETFCRFSWEKYARIHNLDLIVIQNVIDDSIRAKSRSPAWQKCLILSHKDVKKYDQVAWVDSDILINPTSPSIFENVPIEKIGAVDDYSTPNREDHRIALKRLYEYWSMNRIDFIDNTTATEYHKNFGLEGDFDSVVQTGVLVLSPKHHHNLLEHVYDDYEDKGDATWNYEMRPLSFEILINDMYFWINPKFNMPWPYVKQFLYPFLDTSGVYLLPKMNKALNKMELRKSSLETMCATTAFLNNYFLHFAGCANEMKFVNQNITSIFQVDNMEVTPQK